MALLWCLNLDYLINSWVEIQSSLMQGCKNIRIKYNRFRQVIRYLIFLYLTFLYWSISFILPISFILFSSIFTIFQFHYHYFCISPRSFFISIFSTNPFSFLHILYFLLFPLFFIFSPSSTLSLMLLSYILLSRAAWEHLRAGSTFPVPVCTVPSSLDRNSRCNKVEFTFSKGAEVCDALILRGATWASRQSILNLARFEFLMCNVFL